MTEETGQLLPDAAELVWGLALFGLVICASVLFVVLAVRATGSRRNGEDGRLDSIEERLTKLEEGA